MLNERSKTSNMIRYILKNTENRQKISLVDRFLETSLWIHFAILSFPRSIPIALLYCLVHSYMCGYGICVQRNRPIIPALRKSSALCNFSDTAIRRQSVATGMVLILGLIIVSSLQRCASLYQGKSLRQINDKHSTQRIH